MTEDTKHEISAILGLLRTELIRNGVSIGVNQKGDLLFFDTKIYNNSRKFDGFRVDINNLVK